MSYTLTTAILIATVAVSLLCFNNVRLFNALSLNPYKIFHYKQWYRIVSHGFVHADLMHLIINMLVFASFGTYVENLLRVYSQEHMVNNNGMFNYLLLYFGGMVAASIHDLVKYRNEPRYNSIGASGAVAAVIFASIFFDPWGKIYFFGILPIPGIVFGLIYLFYSQYMSKRDSDNINHNAHFYGAVYGFLFPLLMDYRLWNHFVANLVDVKIF